MPGNGPAAHVPRFEPDLRRPFILRLGGRNRHHRAKRGVARQQVGVERLNEALGRRRSAQRRSRQLREQSVAIIEEYREKLMAGSNRALSPEADVARNQIAKLLEAAVAGLPEEFRLVLMLRDVDGLSVEETAEVLQILPQTVKTRLLRARRRLQATLEPSLQDALKGAFPFAGTDCEALTERVLEKFGADTGTISQ